MCDKNIYVYPEYVSLSTCIYICILTSQFLSFFFAHPISLYFNAVAIDYRFVTITLCSAFLSLILNFIVTSGSDVRKSVPFVAQTVVVNKIYLHRDVSLHASIQLALATRVCRTIYLIAHRTFYPLLTLLLVQFIFRFFHSTDYLIIILRKSRLDNFFRLFIDS